MKSALTFIVFWVVRVTVRFTLALPVSVDVSTLSSGPLFTYSLSCPALSLVFAYTVLSPAWVNVMLYVVFVFMLVSFSLLLPFM